MVLPVLQVFEPGVDGAFRHVEKLVEFLIEHHYQVSVVYSSARSSDRLFELVDKVRASGGSATDIRVSNRPTMKDLHGLYILIKLLRSRKFEVVHAHSSKAGVLARVASRLADVPCIYTPHAYFGMGSEAGMRAASYMAVERWLRNFAHTINVSNEELAFARDRLQVNPRMQSLIHNGVDFSRFVPGDLQRRVALRQKLDIPQDALVLGTVARFSSQKNPQLLYRTFARVAALQPEIYLAHLGNGELRGEIEQMVEAMGLRHRVRFIDYLADPESFYCALDGFILTSRYEGLPLSVLEALACNLPTILTDVPGNRTFQEFPLDQIWYGNDEESLAPAIESWHHAAQREQPPNHRDVARTQFSADACFERITALYSQARNRVRQSGGADRAPTPSSAAGPAPAGGNAGEAPP
jgi:glycosyltransferase involved in cell wall biosynthesis